MCGFSGVLGLNGAIVSKEVVDKMADVLQHRGPDEVGSYVSRSVGFGFRRLSILDLSPAGHQPMISEDGQKVLVFNGEIFNYVELREELKGRGYKFRSSGDTEVLLHAYTEWGMECLKKLNGMWAFLIYDLKKGTLFGSRDRFGIKPLYRYQQGDYIFFGSEIKAILQSGGYCGSVNWDVASRFLILHELETNQESFYEGIEAVGPGTAFEIDLHGNEKQWSFWSLDQPHDHISNYRAIETYQELFDDAVRIRMRSDVPIGVCLSGGMDSTSIICSMAAMRSSTPHNGNDPVVAFSYMAEEFDESAYIADTLRQTGAELNKLFFSPEKLLENLERFLWYQDEPVHSLTGMIGFELMRLASESGVKVVLNGQGADETIGGYPPYFENYWYTLICNNQISKVRSEIKEYCRAHGGNENEKFRKIIVLFLKSFINKNPLYKQLGRWRLQKKVLQNTWFSKDLIHRFQVKVPSYENALHQVLKDSVVRSPLPLYLRIEDRNSMAHSVEARLPFMDYRLISFMFSQSDDLKISGPWNKYILRMAMKKRIPESVRNRIDKMGFPSPSHQWFATVFYEPMQDILASRDVKERGIYNVDRIRKDLERHKHGEIEAGFGFFNIAQFEAWNRQAKPYV